MSKKEFPEVLISGNVRQNRLAGGRGGRQGKNVIKDDNKVNDFFYVSQNCKKILFIKGRVQRHFHRLHLSRDEDGYQGQVQG